VGSNLMAPALAIPLLGYPALHSALVIPGSLSIAGMLCFAAVVYGVKSYEVDITPSEPRPAKTLRNQFRLGSEPI
jgi:hypothetical protein